jgi:cell division protein FtsW (lipid II flippase)
MLEYAGSQRTGLQRNRDEGVALAGVLRSLDWLLVAGVAGLVAVGLWAISGVTRFDVTGNPDYYVKRQIVYVCVGVVALAIGLLLDPDLYRRLWRPIFFVTIGLIAIVLVVGRAARGSTRWIDVGFFTFQPSEFGKLLFVLAIAGFVAERARAAADPTTTLRTIGLGLVPILFVFAQPDLGTALVYSAALAAMLFVAGTPWRQLAAVGSLVAIVLAFVLWRGLRVLTVARDLFSAVVAGGIVVALLFQIFVNVGMTMGIAPITGIPLPFVSVGGSSMIANLAAMGILLAIHARGRVARSPRRNR